MLNAYVAANISNGKALTCNTDLQIINIKK